MHGYRYAKNWLIYRIIRLILNFLIQDPESRATTDELLAYIIVIY
jgi:hypothetical protein